MSVLQQQRYERYKDSGIEWLGEVPAHWEIKRIKDVISKIASGVTPKGGSTAYVDEGITFLRSQNVYDDGLRLHKVAFISNEINAKMNGSQAKPGDILLNITGASIGRSCVVPLKLKSANISQHILLLRFKKSLVPFVSNYIKSESIKKLIDSVQLGASKQALNMGQTLNFPLLIPPLAEQRSIAQHLKIQTAFIDDSVSLLKQKITKYLDLKKALINETVCRGLDPHAPRKPSGIAWLGDIPAHWEVKRLKDVGFVYSGLSGKSGEHFHQDFSDQTSSYIPFTNIAGNLYIDPEDLKPVAVFENESQNEVRQYDLFFLMSSESYEDIGKTSLLTTPMRKTYLNSFCKGFRITQKFVNPYYLNHALNTQAFRERLMIQGKGFTRINLKIEKITDFEIIVPPLTEQLEIVNHLETKLKSLKAILENIKAQIIILKELRKTLINDVVTGKLKVTS